MFRTRVKRRSQNSEEEKDKKENQDIKEAIIRKCSKEEGECVNLKLLLVSESQTEHYES